MSIQITVMINAANYNKLNNCFTFSSKQKALHYLFSTYTELSC